MGKVADLEAKILELKDQNRLLEDTVHQLNESSASNKLKNDELDASAQASIDDAFDDGRRFEQFTIANFWVWCALEYEKQLSVMTEAGLSFHGREIMIEGAMVNAAIVATGEYIDFNYKYLDKDWSGDRSSFPFISVHRPDDPDSNPTTRLASREQNTKHFRHMITDGISDR